MLQLFPKYKRICTIGLTLGILESIFIHTMALG